MKNLILSIIFLSAATFLGLHLYKKGKDVEWIDVEESAPTYLFPARMELESADGRRVAECLTRVPARRLQVHDGLRRDFGDAVKERVGVVGVDPTHGAGG